MTQKKRSSSEAAELWLRAALQICSEFAGCSNLFVKMLGLLAYGATLAVTFVVLLARLHPQLPLLEIVAGTIAVGTILPAFIVYILACLFSAIR